MKGSVSDKTLVDFVSKSIMVCKSLWDVNVFICEGGGNDIFWWKLD